MKNTNLRTIKRFAWIILIFALFPIFARGQGDYYSIRDSTYFSFKLIHRSASKNSRFCEVKLKKDSVVRYTPSEVAEYGFSDGRVYISRSVMVNDTARQVFLQRLVKGDVTLYYYRGKANRTFYIEKDSSGLMEIRKRYREYPDSSFHKFLRGTASDCPVVAQYASLVHYRKRPLQKFFAAYSGCDTLRLPFFSYGVYLQTGVTDLLYKITIDNISLYPKHFNRDYSYTAGVFCDLKLFRSNISIHPELYYQKNAFSGYQINNMLVTDYVINKESVSAPILLRFALPRIQHNLYLDAGMLYTFNFRLSNSLYQTTVDNYLNTVNIGKIQDVEMLSDKQAGFMAGVGFRYRTGFNNYFFSELRYSQVYGLTGETFAVSDVQMLIGIGF